MNKKELYETFGGWAEMKSGIFNQVYLKCNGPVFPRLKIKKRCSGKVIKRVGRKIHEAGGCDAEDDYSRGYDDAITLALSILLEETGYDIEDIID